MIVDARSLRPARLEAPPSKSDAHRAFVLAWMLDLPQPVMRTWPTDVRRIADGLSKLGTGRTIDCGDGAAPFRILLALAATLPGRRSVFTGTPRLAERPHAPLFDALQLRASAWPLEVMGREAPASVEVDCTLSSQYASALLLAVCRAGRGEVVLRGTVASRGYLDITVRWARAAGFELDETPDRLRVLGHRRVAALPPVPPDWSSLGYLLLIARACGGEVRLDGAAPEHPDRAVLEHLDAERVDADVARSPDLAPTLAALALSRGGGVLRNVSILRHKESDRLDAICQLARAVGADAVLEGETLRLGAARRPARFSFDCRSDHRLTLSAVTLAALLHCEAELSNTEGVAKSFPGFYEEVSKAGLTFAD